MDPAKIQADVLGWYAKNQRVLPWRSRGRGKPDPYVVWLSEIMLQQTTVPAVIPYFLKFTEAWPDIVSLARAEDEAVMAAWAGLGYYARARNLLKCARVVASEYGGVFPKTLDGLLSLPGIGPYTAAAISAIAFGEPATVVDGNIERIVSRVFAIEAPLPKGKSDIRAAADILFSGVEGAGVAAVRAFPQALMDIGSDVCTPKNPKCTSCPLRAVCRALDASLPENYPVRAPKKVTPLRMGRVYWVTDKSGRVLVEKRPDDRMLGGMIGLPSTDWDRDKSGKMPEHLPEYAGRKGLRRIGVVYHVFTHFKLELEVWAVSVPDFKNVIDSNGSGAFRALDLSGVRSVGLPGVFLKAATLFI